MTDSALLELDNVHAEIQKTNILKGIDLEVNKGELVGFVGRNGAGKTTTFKTIMRLIDTTDGKIVFKDERIEEKMRHHIPGLGIGYQPENRELFIGLNVDQNLRIPIWNSKKEVNEDELIEEIYTMFSELVDRKETNVENLSGGEGKMVAIGRALALQPDLLLLDEPLEGLAPVVVENLKQYIKEINERGIAVLMAEANVQHVNDIADRIYVIERGEITDEYLPHEVPEDLFI